MHLHAAGNGLALSPRTRQMQTQSTVVVLQAKIYCVEQLQSSMAGLRAVEAHVAECPTGDLLSGIASMPLDIQHSNKHIQYLTLQLLL